MLKKLALLLMLVAPMSIFAQKFGYFKSESIILVMPEYAKAQTDIQALQKQYEDEIKRASDEFNKKFAEFQQDAQQQLQKAYADMMAPIYEKMEKSVQTVSKAGGYIFVFDLNRTDIPYVDETQAKDITNDIKTNLGISLSAAPYVPQVPATLPAAK